MKGVVQGPEDLLYDRLLTMLALGLSCFPISPDGSHSEVFFAL